MNSTSNELLHYRFRVMKYIQYILIIRVILRVIRDILLNGIADINIKRDMHRPNPDEASYWCDNFVEYRDCTKFQPINIHICPISLSSKGKKGAIVGPRKNHAWSSSAINKSRTDNWPDCKKVSLIFSKKFRGWNGKPHARPDSC